MAESLVRTHLDRNGPRAALVVAGELDVASGPPLEHAVARVRFRFGASSSCSASTD